MKKIFTIILSLMLCSSVTFSQRYLEEIFTDVDVTSNVVYGMNATVLAYQLYNQAVPQPLVCDIYEPNGDIETARPLILYFHTGNFLPHPQNQSATGTKTDSATVEMCMRLARMGYVVASCDYRLGWNPIAPTQDERVYTLINAAYRGVQDCRTAVRYFRMTAEDGGNPYAIDDTRICVWGQGTGGYIAFAAATIDEYTDIVIPKFTHDVEYPPGSGEFIPLPMVIEEVNGDIYGTSFGMAPNENAPDGIDTLCYANHVDYSSDFNVMVNMGGAMGDSTWLDANDPPMVSFHSPTDPFAPYGVGTVIVPGLNLPVVEVSGSGHVQELANALGLNNVFEMADDAGDAFTMAANTFNGGNFGLFPLNVPATQPADSAPWEWWASDNVNNANGLATNPDMSAAKGNMFLDTIQAYAAPRVMCALMLPGSPCEVVGGPENDLCANAIDINTLFTGGLQQSVSSDPYTNVDATAEDPAYPGADDCFVPFENEPSVDATVWFTFEGDGDMYNIFTTDCDGTVTFGEGDTQMIVYSGDDCGNLVLAECNDDINTAEADFWAGLPIDTDDGTTYYVMVDGFNYAAGVTDGEFCLEVTQITVSVDETALTQFSMFPNPTNGNFRIRAAENIQHIEVFNTVGELVLIEQNVNTRNFEVRNELAAGLYTVTVQTAYGSTTQKLVIE
ncbi:MAG: T9SS type A sorting domain-containing protein [Flavobacteriales bacterium]